ncbi:MAG: glycogen synthase [Anaerolineaceae bacterium]
MKILFASAEVDPFSKVGGLADVAAALPQRLREIGHDIQVVTPCHASSSSAFETSPTHRSISIPFPDNPRHIEIATVNGVGGVPVHLVSDPHFFDRENIYGEPDDLARYQSFCRVILEMLKQEDWRPDILHLNDWHTAPCAFALRSQSSSNPGLRGIASVFTIHNLRYRGPDEFNDFLSQAIYYSDMVTTVSPTYAHEVLTQEFGEGLESLLGLRSTSFAGILNGLNTELFNPRTDPSIAHQFDLSNIGERQQNRVALRSELGLSTSEGPLAAMVTRLTEQKGVDLVIQAMPALVAADAQLIVLGDGDQRLKDDLSRVQLAHPGRVRLAPRFDERLARRIYAGSDVFLMPSRYEPCGLGQLIAMRYGSVPIGRRTGGLTDSIVDPDEHPESPTGFLFDEISGPGFAGAFERAALAFKQPAPWRKLQVAGMSKDFSWNASAKHYVDVYIAALRSRGIVPLQ